MPEQTVLAELKAILKIEPKKNEAPADFAKRLIVKANDLEDSDWQSLSLKSQVWVNAGIEALQAKKAVALPEGLDAPEVPDEPAPKKGKEKPAKAAVKDKKEAKPSGRGPKGKFAKTDKIKVVPKENPFRSGTKCYNWFASIKNGMTVAQAVEAGAPRHHIRWAHTLGHLTIGG